MPGKTPDGSGYTTYRGGRTPGSKNVRTIQLEKIIAEQAAKLKLQEAPKPKDAHELLIQAYQDLSLPMKDRLAAAQAAIRFEKPALSSEDRKISGEIGHYRAIPVSERDAITVATIAQELIED